VAGCLPFYESAAVRAGLWRMARCIILPGAPRPDGQGDAVVELLAALSQEPEEESA